MHPRREGLLILQKWLKEKCNRNYTLYELKQLRGLDISFNKIDKLPAEINLLKNLDFLSCSNNDLTEVNIDLPKLKIFLCHYNKINKLEVKSDCLETVSCHNNQIIKISLICKKLLFLQSDIIWFEKATSQYELLRKFGNNVKLYQESNLTEKLF